MIEFRSNEAIMSLKIFEQEQISRAVELRLGVTSPDKIDIRLKSILARG
jgi:hypothetical protein